MKVKVAIIDTEVHEHVALQGLEVNNCWHSDLTGECWHGTAICGEIYRMCKDIEVDVYPVFSDFYTEAEDVLKALRKIQELDKVYDVINMSMGIEDASLGKEIQEVCDRLREKGTIIVAAFNNNGAMSYPACLNGVIGVDLSMQEGQKNGFIYIEGGTVDIIGPMLQRNVLHLSDTRKMVIGSSFYCAYITGIICDYLAKSEEKRSREDVNCFLKSKALEVKIFERHEMEEMREIKKAILFPYSKELLTVLNLHKYTTFDLVGVYDLKYSKYYANDIQTLDGHHYKVEGVNKIEWEEFDTLILGHIDGYLKMSMGEYVKDVIDKCILYGKKIYALDGDVRKLYAENDDRLERCLYYPCVNNKYFPHSQLGKMWEIPVPVVAVLGTRSQQGKFTTQIQMGQCLRENGYRVGLIASEATGGLFGADYMFPYGYNKTVDVPHEEYAIYINEMAYKSYMKGRDIILFSLQTGTMPRHYKNMNQCTMMQFSLLFGLSPDIVVLCVSPDDEIELIERTIEAVEAVSQAIVSSVVVNPIVVNIDENGRISKINLSEVNKERYDEFISEVARCTNKAVYKMNEENVIEMTENILEMLQE